MSGPNVAYRAEVAGVQLDGPIKLVLLEGLDINESIDGVNTLVANVVSTDGAFRVDTDDEFVLYRTDLGSPETIRFAGIVIDVEEVGFVGPNDDAIVMRVTVTDFKDFLERRYVTEDRPAETLKARLTALVAYLAVYGVTLDPAQANGPDVVARSYVRTKVLTAISDLVTETEGYQLGLSYSKVLGMYAPGSIPAAFDLIEGEGTEKGDLKVKRTRQQSINRVIVQFGPSGVLEVEENWTGDGSTTEFPFAYPATSDPLLHVVEVTNAGPVINYETIGEAGDSANGAIWEIDRVSDPMTITRMPGGVPTPVANGAPIRFLHNSAYPQQVIVEDAADILARGPWEQVIERSDITDRTVAEAIGSGELAKRLAQPTVVNYDTIRARPVPGTLQHITSARRDVDGDFIITEVTERNEPDSDGFMWSVTAVDTDQYTGWRQWHRDILGSGSSGGAGSSSSSVGAPASVSPFASSFPLGGSLNASPVNVSGEIRPIARDEPEIPWSSLGSGLVAKARVLVQTSAGTVTPEIVDDLTNVYSNGSTTSATPVLKEITIPATTADRTYYLRFAVSGGASAGSIRGGGHIQLKRAA